MGRRAGLSGIRVQVWFCNRRAKCRRKDNAFHQKRLPPTCAHSVEDSSKALSGDSVIVLAESLPPPELIAPKRPQVRSSRDHPVSGACARPFPFYYPMPEGNLLIATSRQTLALAIFLAELCGHISLPRPIRSGPTSSPKKVFKSAPQCMYYWPTRRFDHFSSPCAASSLFISTSFLDGP